jgi:transcriptional regulator with XRE-family HTH domain
VSTSSHSTVAANVRAELARRQIRHATVAVDLGYTPQAMSRRLSGAVPFTAVDLQHLARIVDVPIDDLLAEPEPTAAAG